MITRRPARLALVTLGLVAACGGSPAVTTAPATTDDPVVTTVAPETSPAPADGGAGAEALDVCGLLAEDDIRDVTGSSVTGQEAGVVQGIYPDGCTWTLDGNAAESEIVVGVITPGGRAYYDEHFGAFAGQDGYEPLAGIGDAALADTTLGDVVIAAQGDTMVSVQYVIFPTANDGTAEALTRLVLDALGG